MIRCCVRPEGALARHHLGANILRRRTGGALSVPGSPGPEATTEPSSGRPRLLLRIQPRESEAMCS